MGNNLITLTYHSTNYYVLDIKGGKLLVDCGWGGSFKEFSALADRLDLNLHDVKYVLITHFHMDHAGLVQEFKNLEAKLILMPTQSASIQALDDSLRTKNAAFCPIELDDNLMLAFSESRTFLGGIGLDGDIIPTPGHSQDHITLILDDGSAFTGDLPPFPQIPEDQPELRATWRRILDQKITRILPAHGVASLPPQNQHPLENS